MLEKRIKGIAKATIPSSLWRRMRLARLQWAISHYPCHYVEHSYGGSSLKVWLADPLAAGWYDHDWPSLPELNLLSQHRLRLGATVFDIGAHQGIVAMMLAGIVGNSGTVVAVEANPHNASIARKNFDLNGIGNIRVVDAAVGNRSGELSFSPGFNGHVDDGGGEWGRITVPCVKVDELADRYGFPDVLFIDVEGFELAVLHGAEQTLREKQPDCFVEVHIGCGLEKFGGNVASLIEAFPTPQYFLMFCDPERDHLFSPFELARCPSHRFYLVALASTHRELRGFKPDPASLPE